MNEIKYFKLNEDDILEIVSEYVAEKTGIKEFSSKSIAYGTPSKDLRIIVAVGDSSLSHVDLEEVDKTLDFNGDHSLVKGLTDAEMIKALDRMIKSGEY